MTPPLEPSPAQFPTLEPGQLELTGLEAPPRAFV
jgi:hypothetical protein